MSPRTFCLSSLQSFVPAPSPPLLPPLWTPDAPTDCSTITAPGAQPPDGHPCHPRACHPRAAAQSPPSQSGLGSGCHPTMPSICPRPTWRIWSLYPCLYSSFLPQDPAVTLGSRNHPHPSPPPTEAPALRHPCHHHRVTPFMPPWPQEFLAENTCLPEAPGAQNHRLFCCREARASTRSASRTSTHSDPTASASPALRSTQSWV